MESEFGFCLYAVAYKSNRFQKSISINCAEHEYMNLWVLSSFYYVNHLRDKCLKAGGGFWISPGECKTEIT